VGRLFFRHALVVTPSASLGHCWLTYAAWLGIDSLTLDAVQGSVPPTLPRVTPTAMAPKKTGSIIPCCVCGKEVYKPAAYLARGIARMTCGAAECKSANLRGANNPFWNRRHDPETRERIKAGRRANPPARTGPPKGFRHTPEAREKIAAASKAHWARNRDKMLAIFRETERPNRGVRHRSLFSPAMRRDWLGQSCLWCGDTNALVLDHILPVMCGGKAERKNAQTLCQPCNLWKMVHVDRPLYLAGVRPPEGPSTPSSGCR